LAALSRLNMVVSPGSQTALVAIKSTALTVAVYRGHFDRSPSAGPDARRDVAIATERARPSQSRGLSPIAAPRQTSIVSTAASLSARPDGGRSRPRHGLGCLGFLSSRPLLKCAASAVSLRWHDCGLSVAHEPDERRESTRNHTNGGRYSLHSIRKAGFASGVMPVTSGF
jgi:hypothetical protein